MKRTLVWMLLATLSLPWQALAQETEEPSSEATATAEDEPTEDDTIEDDTIEDDAAATANEEDAEPEEPEDERTSFDVQVGPGGGRTLGKAGAFEYGDGRYVLATEGVELKYRDLKLTADVVRIDIPNNLLTAEGNIIFDEGPRRLAGDTLEYDLDSRTGRLTNATAFVDPDYYFSGEEIAKLGDNVYSISDGVFTSCSQDLPSWSIHLSDATVTVGRYAKIKNARMKLKKLPIFYVPYMIWPARTERTSGLLVPHPGYSSRRGGYLGMAYFQTMGRSADTTFYADLYTKEFFGFGTQVRYRPSERSEGNLQAYVITEPDDIDLADFEPILDPDRVAGDTRWKFRYFHQTDGIWKHFKGVISIAEFSDFDFQRDYERDVSLQTRPFFYSNAYLTGNIGQSSFNVMVDRRERLLRNSVDKRWQLPEIEYNLRPTRLGNTPIYFSLKSSMHYLAIDLGPDNAGRDRKSEYGRADIFPTISIPVSTLPWLSAKLDLGGRSTFYTKSLPADDEEIAEDNDDLLAGGSLSRVFPQAGLEIVGPSFSRIFDNEGGKRFGKFKHVIEPRAEYVYVGDFDEQSRISRFDEIDILQPANGFLFSLTNRLLAKPVDEEEGGAFEIASFEIAQGYSLDDDQPGQTARDGSSTRESPLFASFRFNPSRKNSLKADVSYNTLFNDVQSVALTAGTAFGPHGLGLTWRTQYNLDATEVIDGETVRVTETTLDQARLFASLAFIPEKLLFDAAVSYDVKNSKTLDLSYFLRYQAQCYSLQLEFRESNFRQVKDTDYRFSFTLKNVGTFIDLTGGLNSSN